MSQFHRLFSLFAGLLILVACANVYAGTKIIISAAPPAKEIIVPPRGYVKCRVIPAGFYNGVWQEQHRVCNYAGNQNRGVWVSGYWKCLNFKPYNGVCVRWSWVGSHWENQRVVAYGPPPPPRAVGYRPPPPPRPVVYGPPPTVIRVTPPAPPVYN